MAEPDLHDLDAFAAVARHRSFRNAARLKGVSASSLSEAVRRVEERLGVRLLNRTTRSVTTTEAGARLLERLVPALGEIAGALDVVNQYRDSPSGTLRLNVPGAVARIVLPRIASGFLIANPAVVLDVTVEDRFVDVVAGGFDAGIRYGERLEQDMIAVPLGPRMQRYGVGASPGYIALHGAPSHPRDVVRHAAIRHRFDSGVVYDWEFEKDGKEIRVSPPPRLLAGSHELEIGAAEAGLGLIASFEGMLAPSFERGTLVPVLEDWWQTFPGPFLYYPSRRLMPSPLRAFVDYVKAEGTW